MLYIDLPTKPRLAQLGEQREDGSVSIYLETTPLTQDIGPSRTVFKQLGNEALEVLAEAGFDKRDRWRIERHLNEIAEDDEFWSYQARSLCVLVTAGECSTFRLPNRLKSSVHVSDRFNLRPLMRALTFRHNGFVLALAENDVRLIEIFPDSLAREVDDLDMPTDAASHAGKSTLNDRAPVGRIQGSEGKKLRLHQFAKAIDGVLAPYLEARGAPLILAAVAPLSNIYRDTNSYPQLADETIALSPGNLIPADLENKARDVLDALYEQKIHDFHAQADELAAGGRVAESIDTAALAATHGAVETLLVCMDTDLPGRIDRTTGKVDLAQGKEGDAYGVLDEIACRAMATGARVMVVRSDDLPQGKPLRAILRYPVAVLSEARAAAG